MKLNEVCEILAGYAFNANDFITNGFPIIKIKNISLDERVNYDVNSTIDPQLIKPSIFLKYLCVKDDFVIAMTGNTIGKMGRIVEGKYLLNQRVAKFIPFTNICLKRYLFYALSNPKFKLFIENNLDSSTAQANISTSTLGNYELTIHSIDEQQHIVNIIFLLVLKFFLILFLNHYFLETN